MSGRRTWTASLGCALALALAAPVSAGPAAVQERPQKPSFLPSQVVVRFDAGSSADERRSALASVHARSSESLLVPRARLVQLPPNTSVEQAVATLQRRRGVTYAEPNYVRRAAVIPNDLAFEGNWGLHNTGQTISGQAGTADADIDAPAAWDVENGTSSTKIAVLDTGIAYTHADLDANMWVNPGEIAGNGVDDDGNGLADDVHGYDFINSEADPYDYHGHGTHVAGTIAAETNNNLGVAGVNWDANLIAVQVLGADGYGSSAAIANGYAYAGDVGARVANASLGGGGSSMLERDAILGASGTLFVVAAGNSAANNDVNPQYPCNYSAANIVCVAATDNNDALASFSNYGTTMVDVAAPGVAILSTIPRTYEVWSEDFSTGLGKFTTGGTASWGVVDGVAMDSPTGSYAAYANTWIRTASPVALAEGCIMKAQVAIDTEANYDYLRIEASTDATSWTLLDYWSGTSIGYFPVTGALDDYRNQNVYLRFRLTSDDIVQYNGVSVNDVKVRCAERTGYDGFDFGYMSGTSMASPHAAGVAGLLVSRQPDLSVSALRNALVSTGDIKAGLTAKTVTGRRINAAAALASIGAPEVCDGIDNDGDGIVDDGVKLNWYPDLDGDGYGDAEALPVAACTAPPGHVGNNGDPNDSDAAVPGSPGNDAPVFTGVAQQHVNEGAEVAFTVTATDPDGDNVTYSLSQAPAAASVDPSTGAFSWAPGYSDAGTYTITFVASDGSLQDSMNVSVMVHDAQAASQTTVSVRKTRYKVKATGAVTPVHSGALMTVKLQRKKAGKWAPVAVKQPVLSALGTYSAAFARPSTPGNYRFVATFPGDGDHAASSARKGFTL